MAQISLKRLCASIGSGWPVMTEGWGSRSWGRMTVKLLSGTLYRLSFWEVFDWPSLNGPLEIGSRTIKKPRTKAKTSKKSERIRKWKATSVNTCLEFCGTRATLQTLRPFFKKPCVASPPNGLKTCCHWEPLSIRPENWPRIYTSSSSSQ